MPPVSVTMQPRNLPEAEALDVPVELDELDPFADGALDVLLPHAASSTLAVAAAAVINAVCLTVSSTAPGCRSPGAAGVPPGPDCPKAKA
jgi:hypothetical protein